MNKISVDGYAITIPPKKIGLAKIMHICSYKKAFRDIDSF
jgi:hypothetical protein